MNGYLLDTRATTRKLIQFREIKARYIFLTALSLSHSLFFLEETKSFLAPLHKIFHPLQNNHHHESLRHKYDHAIRKPRVWPNTSAVRKKILLYTWELALTLCNTLGFNPLPVTYPREILYPLTWPAASRP